VGRADARLGEVLVAFVVRTGARKRTTATE
jgi:hypothetical protein